MSKIWLFIDRRLNLSPLLREMADHRIPDHANPLKKASAFMYCFGGISFLILLLQLLTGMFLMLYYVPSPDHAYASVSYIKNEVAFGALTQNLHRVGASAAVVMVFLHMLRVYFTKSYKNPRELNWIAGVLLLLVVLGFGFTGYLLPWDQKAYWATTVGVNIIETVPWLGGFIADMLRGGDEVGALTLTRFFVIHVMFLPALLLCLLAAHFFMVRRQGISHPL
ncbi:MAG: cytochrome b N-terminal domain-containing protein [Deltaproteobacteria bacterium]|jgi:menaquinol-cytochrome c reductase cytochrome b subunit|nr:cytochrome b N-terminal domain-containing protein [Deltaproteobacteria bacterium]